MQRENSLASRIRPVLFIDQGNLGGACCACKQQAPPTYFGGLLLFAGRDFLNQRTRHWRLFDMQCN